MKCWMRAPEASSVSVEAQPGSKRGARGKDASEGSDVPNVRLASGRKPADPGPNGKNVGPGERKSGDPSAASGPGPNVAKSVGLSEPRVGGPNVVSSPAQSAARSGGPNAGKGPGLHVARNLGPNESRCGAPNLSRSGSLRRLRKGVLSLRQRRPRQSQQRAASNS